MYHILTISILAVFDPEFSLEIWEKNSRNMRKNKRHFIVFFIYIGFLFQFKCEGKEVLELKEGQLLQRKRQYAKRLVNINLC